MFAGPLRLLGWIGQRGTAAVAVSVLIGMFLPFLSALVRPFLSEAVFVLLVLAFLRVDSAALITRFKKPVLLIAASMWMLLVVPAFALMVFKFLQLDSLGPEVMLALFIATAAPSVMSAPAFVYLMGLDGALSLSILVVSMVLTPLTAPLIGTLMLDGALPLDSITLGVQLFSLLAGSYLVALLLRKVSGKARIERYRTEIDGLNVVILFLFALAAMDGVADSFLARPLFTAGLAALTFALALTQIGVSLALFSAAGRPDAFVIGHATGARNMGLMVAALGGTLPELTWLWFALGQLPIYMLPLLLKPFALRFSHGANHLRT